MGALLDQLGEFVVWLVFEVVMTWTGEVVLWLLSAGRYTPRWDLHARERPSRFVALSERSCWIGIVTWVAAVAVFLRATGSG